ncbi:ArpU family phage packaging/lysis transcriptional regulator [Pediococcus claussenii]|uniref:Phage transcriptional regulator, ArpU family protein n=1 Tax=Pediococcus claussenii (strain ATCC BAA-344 / DSM 14800 / JCM 18046 / KCTC 3811 / LMG 21948 / P06) TaxID=701521 RepID=G8PCA4_PEDCP|nr:ArpU family phage packaging/lysis transcriptional regulator [Pediococcus claussenii]AEV94889.1 phage transcriptional regulator, ArpU family protein [Pediococcus claussenii ATCC BAA-344]ANZ70085.1 hypothetical protein AYR57_07035 [Pediococcus claussenii]ANZ71900.1 hypothetical protein AYR58_07035 [Pediococcus claussenii]KRN18807.1 hypothetical protein IV79_GL000358 [Pediococcus claussenii]
MAKYDEVARVLKQVPRLKRIAGKRLTDLRSPSPDGMPHGNGVEVDERIIGRLDAQKELENIMFCLSFLRDDYQQILLKKYMTADKQTDIAIAMDLGISDGTLYRWQSKALQEFKEAYYGY